MARRPKDRKLEKGIRTHGRKLQAYIRVNGELRLQTFDPDTPRPEIRQWLLDQQAESTPKRRGTLAADIQTYLAGIANPKARVDAAGRLQHWLRSPLRDLPRAMITPADIRAHMARLLREPQARTRHTRDGPRTVYKPLSVETVNKCLMILRAVYRALNTDRDANPTLKVSKLAVEEQPPKALTFAVGESVLALMPDRGQAHPGKGNRSTTNKAKLRCAVMLYTGWPPIQIMRIVPSEDILWGPPVRVRLRPRRKGKGVKERWMPVTPKAAAALKALVDGQATGRFTTSGPRRAWQRAWQKYRRAHPTLKLPAHSTPYDLRHTFIAHTLKASGNLAGTQHLAMHSDPRQTLRYASAVIPDAAEQAAEAAGVAQGVAKPPEDM